MPERTILIVLGPMAVLSQLTNGPFAGSRFRRIRKLTKTPKTTANIKSQFTA
jgi:hypothetical protein